MKRLFFSLLFLTFTSSAHAALAPFYESIREIKDVLDARDLYDILGDESAVDSITKTKNGYQITSGRCRLDVRLQYQSLPMGLIGPAEYKLKFEKLKCPKN